MANLSKWNPFQFNRKSKKRETETGERAVARRGEREAWQDPFERMERQMNTLMRGFFNDDFWTPSLRASSQRPSFFGDFSPTRFSPSVDVTSENDRLVVSAELPGLDKSDIDITVDDDYLTLKGEKRHGREKDEDGCYRTERYFGSFTRTVPLPADVDANSAEANFDNGVLTVKFPKRQIAEDDGPRRLELG